MKYLLVVLLFCAIIFSGCGKATVATGPVSPGVPTFMNGYIVSDGAIMVQTRIPKEEAALMPGVIVKLDSGKIVAVRFYLSEDNDLKGYKIAYGEKVRCMTTSTNLVMYNKWHLVPLEK